MASSDPIGRWLRQYPSLFAGSQGKGEAFDNRSYERNKVRGSWNPVGPSAEFLGELCSMKTEAASRAASVSSSFRRGLRWVIFGAGRRTPHQTALLQSLKFSEGFYHGVVVRRFASRYSFMRGFVRYQPVRCSPRHSIVRVSFFLITERYL